MGFFSQNNLTRPVRLSEMTRTFAFDSLNHKYGLDTLKNYKVYFAIQDKNRNPIGSELSVNSNKMGSITFELTGDFTDLLKVAKNQYYEIYYYGIKVCSEEDNFEDTLILGSGTLGDLNTITVYPKKVEGI